MFDINEIQGKILLQTMQNGMRNIELKDEVKTLYFENERTKERMSMEFGTSNDQSLVANFCFLRGESEVVESLIIPKDGDIATLVNKSVFNFFIEDNKLFIITPEEFNIYN